MKIAVCGNPHFAAQLLPAMQSGGLECKYFIKDFEINSGGILSLFNPISFFEFRRMEARKELGGVIVAEKSDSPFVKELVPIFKLNRIERIGVIDNHSKVFSLYWLDKDKIFMPQLETQIIDGCNLNCKGCAHFSNLFETNEIYPLEDFDRDLRRLSECADVISFYILGGEPLLAKNLEDYVRITRTRLPKTNLRFLTNGLLIPSLPQSLLDLIRESRAVIDISVYPQTKKILDKIKGVLDTNGILYDLRFVTERFQAFMSIHGGHNPLRARATCLNENCRFLRKGRIYKCPPDALSYRLVEKFKIKDFPAATYADLYSQNFSQDFKMLDGNVEMCFWCNEKPRIFEWQAGKKPQLRDWLANPDEA